MEIKNSVYTKLSNEDKYYLFTGNNISSFEIKNQNDLDFFIREKLAYDTLNHFLLANGAVEFENKPIGHVVKKLEIGTEIGLASYYESKYLNGFLLTSGFFKCKGNYCWVEDKWWYNLKPLKF